MHLPNIWKLWRGGSNTKPADHHPQRVLTKRKKRGGPKHRSRIAHVHHQGDLVRDHVTQHVHHHHVTRDIEIENLASGDTDIKVFLKYKLPDFNEVQRYDTTQLHFDPVFR